ncbi:MAG: EF-hand domain-containing protein [Sulfuritalea sp.]|nr:EF-hand domain-containing protein [Sulfuritalea sp.]
MNPALQTPPPGGMPPGGDSGGLTKDQVTAAAKEVGSTDSKASSALTSLAKNFDTADINQDGKVSFQELVAYCSVLSLGVSWSIFFRNYSHSA